MQVAGTEPRPKNHTTIRRPWQTSPGRDETRRGSGLIHLSLQRLGPGQRLDWLGHLGRINTATNTESQWAGQARWRRAAFVFKELPQKQAREPRPKTKYQQPAGVASRWSSVLRRAAGRGPERLGAVLAAAIQSHPAVLQPIDGLSPGFPSLQNTDHPDHSTPPLSFFFCRVFL